MPFAWRAAGRLDAVHHGVADELNGDVLDRRLIVMRDQMQAVHVEGHGLLVLLGDVLGQRTKRVLEAPGGRRAVGPRDGRRFRRGFLRHELRGLDDLCAVLGHVGRRGGAGRRGLRRARRGGAQGFERGELPVELVELHRERQEIAARERAAAAQIVQRILELPRRPFQCRELERRGVPPHPIDLVERLLEFAAKCVLLARRLLERRIDRLHGRIGSLYEGCESRGAAVEHAAQDLALRLHLTLQVLEFACGLHLAGDVRNTHQPEAGLALERMEFERVVRRIEAPVPVRQPHLEVLERVGVLLQPARAWVLRAAMSFRGASSSPGAASSRAPWPAADRSGATTVAGQLRPPRHRAAPCRAPARCECAPRRAASRSPAAPPASPSSGSRSPDGETACRGTGTPAAGSGPSRPGETIPGRCFEGSPR